MGRRTRHWSWLLLLLTTLVACACSRHASPPAASPASAPQPAAEPAPVVVTSTAAPAPADLQSGPLPIRPDDARWGSDTAPITLVTVLDLQCPFCARLHSTLASLRARYGPEKLRIVVKHNPLPFHQRAERAALEALSVRRAAGDEAFFRFLEIVYTRQQELSDEALVGWAQQVARSRWKPAGPAEAEQLRRDMAFAKNAGAYGTPTSFINGIRVSGAQPFDVFVAEIDKELTAMGEARRAGKPVAYAQRAALNFTPPDLSLKAENKAEDDNKIWKVPVGSSPVLGPPDALVTIVEFADFQCPFCRRVEKTLDEVRAKYGNDVRIVFKHNPLPFHDRAAPAAELAVEAYRQQGGPGFWAAAHALFEAPVDALTEDGLLKIGAELDLNAVKTRKALYEKTHEREIQADIELAQDFGARGTPHFFINGRRLSGAQPYAKFEELIDARLADAKAIVARGVAKRKVYDTILASAEGPAPPDVVDVSGVTRVRASRGPANAPVVVYEFADFQCPFCKRVQPTLEALQKEFPGKIRIAWVNLPLDFHQRARAAANAALAVRARAGDAAFWRMHDLLFESQPELSDERLADLAQRTGADPKTVLEAVQSGKYDASIDEDREAAEHAGIRGTPGFSVNGYFISGAQPLDTFRRIVKRALDDRKRGFVPKPNYKPPAAVAAAKPRISAHHIVIFYQGSMRAPRTVTRSREEARALASKLRQDILGGADFERVAKEHSEDPSAAYGGSLGSFDAETMVKSFSDAAFALKPGQLSDVVETPFGFHVIRRDE